MVVSILGLWWTGLSCNSYHTIFWCAYALICSQGMLRSWNARPKDVYPSSSGFPKRLHDFTFSPAVYENFSSITYLTTLGTFLSLFPFILALLVGIQSAQQLTANEIWWRWKHHQQQLPSILKVLHEATSHTYATCHVPKGIWVWKPWHVLSHQTLKRNTLLLPFYASRKWITGARSHS